MASYATIAPITVLVDEGRSIMNQEQYAQLSSGIDALKKLDAVSISFSPEGRWPYPAALCGMSVALYFYYSETPDALRALIDCLNEYVERVGDKLAAYSVNGNEFNGISRPFPPIALADAEALFKEDGGYSLYLTSEAHEDYPGQYTLKSLCVDDCGARKRISRVQFCMPMGFLLEQEQGYLRQMLEGWARRLRPYHGTAGIGLIFAASDSLAIAAGEEILYGLERFPGLQADNVYLHSDQLKTGILGVSWYTLLCNELLEKAGGRSALDRLGGDFTIWDYPGGVCVVSGPLPELGDKEHKLTPDFCARLHTVLRPVYSGDLTMVIAIRADPERAMRFTETWKYRYDVAAAGAGKP